MVIDFTIFGEAASKANSRKFAAVGTKAVEVGDKTVLKPLIRPIKSAKSLDFEASAGYQIPTYAQLRLEGPLRITAVMYYASNRPDLDESLLLDILQDKYGQVGKGKGAKKYLARPGVYRNDRQIKHKDIRHGGVSDQPRVDIRIETLFMFDPAIPGFPSVEAQREREAAFRREQAADVPKF